MKAPRKNVSLATVLILTVGPLIVTACGHDEPRSVSTTERSVTRYDDGSTRSSSTTHTEVNE